MKSTFLGPKLTPFFVCLLLLASAAPSRGYTNLSIAVYFRYQEVQSTPNNLAQFSNAWANVEKQVKVDKVYLETTRNGELATDAAVTAMKKFFQDRGIKVSGGLGLTVQESNGFQSYCYSTPAEPRQGQGPWPSSPPAISTRSSWTTSTSPTASATAASPPRADKSWSQFRCEQLDDVSRDLIIGPAKAINPKARLIIKYPNWYESFQGLGYDLAVEPKLFDAIYTGTETRDANSGQRLQSYQSYLQTRYFNNIKPGGNQGGWIDGGGDARYAEQFWDTFFAKVPEITLFNSMQIMRALGGGGRGGPPDTNGILVNLMTPIPQADGSTYTPNMVARTGGYSAELLDRFLGQLGQPIGVATYKPCNSVGEAYLPNYLGMIGIPIDLVPAFPTNAPAVLLTAASRYDHDLVAKVKKFVQAGGRAIATTGVARSAGRPGFSGHRRNPIHRPPCPGHALRAPGAAWQRRSEADLNVLIPQIRRFENDNRLAINFSTALSGYPLAVSATYGQGTFSVLAIPDDFADLYRLPQGLLNQIRSLLGRDLFVSLDAPDHVSLFAYDNHTFIVQNFQSQPVSPHALVVRATRLHDLLTGQALTPARGGEAAPGGSGRGFGRGGLENRGTSFEVTVPAHSFRVFRAE